MKTSALTKTFNTRTTGLRTVTRQHRKTHFHFYLIYISLEGVLFWKVSTTGQTFLPLFLHPRLPFFLVSLQATLAKIKKGVAGEHFDDIARLATKRELHLTENYYGFIAPGDSHSTSLALYNMYTLCTLLCFIMCLTVPMGFLRFLPWNILPRHIFFWLSPLACLIEIYIYT